MKKRVKKITLSRKKGARQALVKNLAKSLIFAGRIKTTKTKAKFAQRYIEKLVGLAKQDTLAGQRRIFSALSDKKVVKKLILEIGSKFGSKTSGFTRIINLSQRRGDAAPMALLEFAYPEEKTTKVTEETPLRAAKQSLTGQVKEAKVKRKGTKNGAKKQVSK